MHILSSQTQCRVTAPVQLQEPSSILRLFANTLLVTWHKSPMGRIRSLLTSGNFFPNCSYWIVLFKEDRQQNGQMIFLTHLALPPEPIKALWTDHRQLMLPRADSWLPDLGCLSPTSAVWLCHALVWLWVNCFIVLRLSSSSALTRTEANRVHFGLFQTVKSLYCFMCLWCLMHWGFGFSCGLYLGHAALQIFPTFSRML